MLVLNDMTSDARVDREATALAESGHLVTVLALRRAGLSDAEDRPSYRVLRVANPTTAPWRQPFAKLAQSRARSAALAAAAIGEGPDIIHAHDSDTLEAAFAAAGKLGVGVVYDAHELYPDMLSEFGAGGSWPVQRYWRRIERTYVPQALAAITVSDGLAREIERRYGISPAVVRNVPALEPLQTTGRLRSELGLVGDSRMLLLYQGVLIGGRGLKHLLDAVNSVPDVVLAVQGFGPLEAELREHAVTLGAGDRVRFMGRIDQADLHEFACGADAGVVIYEHTTLNNYLAAPNKLYAYLMAGLPVLVSDFPGLAEIVIGNKVGATFDPGDVSSVAEAIVTLAGQASERAGMSVAARTLAESSLNWNREQQKLLHLYETLEPSAS